MRMQTYYMTLGERDQVITVRLTREERQMLQTLAENDGISISDVVRMLVRRAHAHRTGRVRKGVRAQ